MSTENVIPEEDYLVFPDHPKFSFDPAEKVIRFDDWVCSGIWVPIDLEVRPSSSYSFLPPFSVVEGYPVWIRSEVFPRLTILKSRPRPRRST